MTDFPPEPFTRSDAIRVFLLFAAIAAAEIGVCKWAERMEQKRQAGRGR